MPENFEVERLVEQWRQRHAAGEPVTPEELCRGQPELLEEVRRQVAAVLSTGPRAAAAASERTVLESGDRKIELHHVYLSLGLHGKGGLGEVYLAQDLDLGRQVAIKFLKPVHADNPETRQQFLLEAEVTGQLDHPGVVPILGCGQVGQQPFYVMRFVSGGTLEDAMKECQPAPSLSQLKRLIGHLRSACETVAYAHSRGIVHCDLKPGNILLGKYGETLVADWGSALPVERDAAAKASGEKTVRAIKSGEMSTSSSSTRPWTPAYMSPEQLPDSPNEIGPASDIFSLGATLYHLLTGRNHVHDLFVAGRPSADALFAWIRHGKAPRPRQLRRDVPPALEAICLKAMALQPRDRYATALELAQDLEAWRTDGRVSVYRPPLLDRLLRNARRHRLASALLGVILLLGLVAGVGGSFWFHENARREHQLRDEAVRTGAKLAAEMLAFEIDLRWHTLERNALDPVPRRELARLPASLQPAMEPPAPELQSWLAERHRLSAHLGAHSWMVADARGVLVGRVPKPTLLTFGRSYRFRDYFHGLGEDLKKDDPRVATLGPLRRPHRSIAYRSDSDRKLLVNFTVPIWGGQAGTDDAVLGVLGMTQEVAKLASLERALAQGQQFMLIDLRPTPLVDPPQSGLVLHHPRLEEYLKANSGKLVFLEPAVLEQVRSWHVAQTRLCDASQPSEFDSGTSRDAGPEPLVLPTWRDPLSPEAADWSAVMMPVFVRGRGEGGAFRDTGFIVVVQRR
jgi:serine/threonine protein kinase